MRYLLVLFILSLIAACGNETPPAKEETSQLGELHASFTVSEAARPAFERGLLLLHNFEYEDARTAFQEARQIDSNAVMAYWGEAMTHNHPLWRQQEQAEAVSVLSELGQNPPERATTDLERDFLEAALILYGEGEKSDRDQAYSDYLKDMHERYPDNEEVAAFYALSILGAVPVGRDIAAYEAGAEVAQDVLAANPRHPGALHYLIHSYDDPAHAHLALDAAAKYSEVAADAVHALHMPSHIFLAVGMWEEVVSSNIASFQASIDRMQEQELTYDALSYHALSWLQYGHLQLGEFAEADRIMDDMIAYTDSMPSKHARGYCIAMKGAYLLETGDWDHPVADYAIDTDDLGITARAKKQFIAGMQAYRAKDATALTTLIDTLVEDIESSSRLVDEKTGVPMCSSGGNNSYKVNRLDLDQATVIVYELKALQAMLDDDTTATEEWFQRATQLEEQLSFGFGPPTILKPSHEMYADWLQEQGRTEEAEKQYEKALERAPNRRLSS